MSTFNTVPVDLVFSTTKDWGGSVARSKLTKAELEDTTRFYHAYAYTDASTEHKPHGWFTCVNDKGKVEQVDISDNITVLHHQEFKKVLVDVAKVKKPKTATKETAAK